MRKKELLEINTTLHNRLVAVTEQLEKYKSLYDENILEINHLRRELVEMERKLNEIKQQPEETVEIQNETPNSEEVAEEVPCEPTVVPITETALSDVYAYGAEIIGNIVLLGTKANNAFADKPNEYSKDLINLVLGKTEVCKSAIFDICNSDESDEIKKAKISEIEKEASEYFENLYKQI